jgi:hypothetical protein
MRPKKSRANTRIEFTHRERRGVLGAFAKGRRLISLRNRFAHSNILAGRRRVHIWEAKIHNLVEATSLQFPSGNDLGASNASGTTGCPRIRALRMLGLRVGCRVRSTLKVAESEAYRSRYHRSRIADEGSVRLARISNLTMQISIYITNCFAQERTQQKNKKRNQTRNQKSRKAL